MDAGYPSATVSEVMGKVESLPKSLVDSYYAMVREDFKERVANDEDYQEKKREGSS